MIEVQSFVDVQISAEKAIRAITDLIQAARYAQPEAEAHDEDRRRIRTILRSAKFMLQHIENCTRLSHALGHLARPRYFNVINGDVIEVSAEDYIDPEADGVKAENATPPIFTPEGITGIPI